MDSSEIKAKVIVSVNSSSIQTLYTCILNKKKFKMGERSTFKTRKINYESKCALCAAPAFEHLKKWKFLLF